MPVAYASNTLNKAESNYTTTEKELLAIIFAVKHFRPYVYGQRFVLLTDHRPLTWLYQLKDPTLSSRLARWKIKLQEYDFEIQYKPGRVNANADALSRNPVEREGEDMCSGGNSTVDKNKALPTAHGRSFESFILYSEYPIEKAFPQMEIEGNDKDSTDFEIDSDDDNCNITSDVLGENVDLTENVVAVNVLGENVVLEKDVTSSSVLGENVAFGRGSREGKSSYDLTPQNIQPLFTARAGETLVQRRRVCGLQNLSGRAPDSLGTPVGKLGAFSGRADVVDPPLHPEKTGALSKSLRVEGGENVSNKQGAIGGGAGAVGYDVTPPTSKLVERAAEGSRVPGIGT